MKQRPAARAVRLGSVVKLVDTEGRSDGEGPDRVSLQRGIRCDMGTHMKTTIEISDPLLRQARALAARQRQTLREVVEESLRQLLGTRKGSKKPFRLRDVSVRGKGLRHGLSYDDWGKILDLAYGDRG